MDLFAWAGRIAFFLVVLWLALENTAVVPLRLSSTLQWEGVPLVAVILVCFVAGVVAGTVAMLPMMWRLRRHSNRRESHRERPGEPSTIEVRLMRAARQGGAVGDLDPETRSRR